MPNLEDSILAALLPKLDGVTVHEKWVNCTKEYPWYALPFFMLAKEHDHGMIQKANLCFNDSHRLHFLLHAIPVKADKWLEEKLALLQEVNGEQLPIEKVVALADNQLELHTRENRIDDLDDGDTLGVGIQAQEAKESPVETIQLTEKQSLIENIDLTAKDGKAAQNETIDQDGKIPSEEKTVIAEPALSNNIKPGSAKGATLEPLAFEPFHSVDYFASQGIKLELNALPKDKFDRQLMSFTQWLKTIKKVNLPEPSSADPVVEAQANQSNANKEVITEAMALVLLKQGKHQKAAEIYRKLLLLHPEKSAFFAAQIEELKNKQ